MVKMLCLHFLIYRQVSRIRRDHAVIPGRNGLIILTEEILPYRDLPVSGPVPDCPIQDLHIQLLTCNVHNQIPAVQEPEHRQFAVEALQFQYISHGVTIQPGKCGQDRFIGSPHRQLRRFQDPSVIHIRFSKLIIRSPGIQDIIITVRFHRNPHHAFRSRVDIMPDRKLADIFPDRDLLHLKGLAPDPADQPDLLPEPLHDIQKALLTLRVNFPDPLLTDRQFQQRLTHCLGEVLLLRDPARFHIGKHIQVMILHVLEKDQKIIEIDGLHGGQLRIRKSQPQLHIQVIAGFGEEV